MTKAELMRSRDAYFLIIEEDDTRVIRDLRYILKEWLENCERVDFEEPYNVLGHVGYLIDEDRGKIFIRRNGGLVAEVYIEDLAGWYLEHRVKVGLRRLIVEDLKEATDEA